MATTLRKQREVRERELHLMEVARKMLIAHGYAGLSMDRLAEATEYSKGTIYQHFSTKEDLVMALASQSMEQRTGLFDRVARFNGRPRERMNGIGIADELFARLYPYSFRSELIIKMAGLDERATPERRELMTAHENRCMSQIYGFVEDAIKVGDLDPSTSVSKVIFAIVTMAIGTHTITSSFTSLMTQTGIVNPFSALRENIHVLLDASAGNRSRPSGTMPQPIDGSIRRSLPMNSAHPSSTEPPRVFFATKSTKRRNPTLGIVGLVVTIVVAVTGRWLLASSAASHATKPLPALPVSVRVLPLVEEVVSSGIRYSGPGQGVAEGRPLVPGWRDGQLPPSGHLARRADAERPRGGHASQGDGDRQARPR